MPKTEGEDRCRGRRSRNSVTFAFIIIRRSAARSFSYNCSPQHTQYFRALSTHWGAKSERYKANFKPRINNPSNICVWNMFKKKISA